MNIDYVLLTHGIGGGKKVGVAPSPISNFKVDDFGDGFLKLIWNIPTDPNFSGVKIQRKTGSYPVDAKDGFTVYEGKGTSFIDSELANDITYYYRAFTFDKYSNYNGDLGQLITGKPIKIDDSSGSPGSPDLIAGTMEAGFFGEVPANDFFTTAQISLACGYSHGLVISSESPWLKFALDGKILFRAKRSLRSYAEWRYLFSAGIVHGKTIIKNGLTYKVRLMRGALTDPSEDDNPDKGAKGSEWNRLLLPIHEKAIDGSWRYPSYVEDEIPVWGHNYGSGANGMYTDSNLGVSTGDGRDVICQEASGYGTDFCVIRGGGQIERIYQTTKNNVDSNYGWVPVLELVR